MTGPATAPLSAVPGRLWFYLIARLLDTAATAGLVTIVGKQIFDMATAQGASEERVLFLLGVLGIVQFVPTFVFSPFAGSIADRFDRRFVSAAGVGVYMALSLALFLYIRTDPTDLLPIYGLMFMQGTTEAFQRPAARALPMDLSPENVITRVMALNAAAWQGGTIVGPVIAGFLFTVTIATPYVAFALMFLVAGIALLLLPDPGVAKLVTGRGGLQAIRDAVEGVRFVRGNPIISGAITLDLFAVLFGGAVALLPAIAEDRLGVDAVGLGWLRAAIGIGAAATTLSLAVRPLERRIGPILMGCVGLFGVGTIVLGATTSFSVAIAALLTLGAADAVSVYIRSTIVPLATPENMRGRVLAVENVFIGASNELGAFESGVTGSLFGLVGAVMFGGVATLVVVGASIVAFPALAKIDSFNDVRANA